MCHIYIHPLYTYIQNSRNQSGPLCGEFTGHHWSTHKDQWRGALMFSLICVWTNGWVNNRDAGDLRRYRAHYDVTVMECEWPHSSRWKMPMELSVSSRPYTWSKHMAHTLPKSLEIVLVWLCHEPERAAEQAGILVLMYARYYDISDSAQTDIPSSFKTRRNTIK